MYFVMYSEVHAYVTMFIFRQSITSDFIYTHYNIHDYVHVVSFLRCSCVYCVVKFSYRVQGYHNWYIQFCQ